MLPALGGLAALAGMLYPEDAEAVNIPGTLVFKDLAKRAAEMLRKGASREEVFDSTKLIPFTDKPQDAMLYLPRTEGVLTSPSLSKSQVDNLSKGMPIQQELKDVYDSPEFYDLLKSQKLKSLPVIRDPRNKLGWLNDAQGSYLPYTDLGNSEAIFLRDSPRTTGKLNSLLGLAHPSVKFSPLEHELGHALQSRAKSSGHPRTVPWGGRIQEISAELGAGDLSPLELIRLLNNWKGSPQRMGKVSKPLTDHPSLRLSE